MIEPVLIPLDNGGRAVGWWAGILLEATARYGKAGNNQIQRVLIEWGAMRRTIGRKRYLEFRDPKDATLFLLTWT